MARAIAIAQAAARPAKALLICALFLAPALPASAAAAPRKATVQFSDGETMEAALSLTPGQKFRLHDGNTLREIAFENIQELRTAPQLEKMERRWRFKEAGRTEKEFWGDPYPVRYLQSTVRLSNGQSVTGHLYTTVLYAEQADKTSKLVLYAKVRGEDNQTFEDLVYPARIAFLDNPQATAGNLSFVLHHAEDQPVAEFAALAAESLARLEAKKTDAAGGYAIASPMGEKLFLAAKMKDRILVGWPEDNACGQLIAAALKDARDFFDDIRLLGTYRESPESSNIYSLLMLFRSGKTSYDAKNSQPWRLGVWRWKCGDDNKLMLAGRGYFFRGIIARGEQPPPVTLSRRLWLPEPENGATINIADDE